LHKSLQLILRFVVCIGIGIEHKHDVFITTNAD
jgi:hypothetical protein